MTTDELTPREREVLDLAERGLTNDAIALRLGISRNAVRYHLKELHSKLGTGSERRRLAGWRRLRALLPGLGAFGAGAGAKLGVGAAMGAFTVAGVAAALTLGGAAGPTPGVEAVDGRYPNGCPDRFNAWHETNLEEFAAEYRGTLGSYEELVELNPELVDAQLPAGTEVLVAFNPDAECHELSEAEMTPASSGTAAKAGTPASASTPGSAPEGPPTPTPVVRYTVAPGDTPGMIAAEYGVTVEELLRANGILDPAQVEEGDILVIPNHR
jgi:DNA-binding CsgD family transcriptional regulator